MNVLFLSSGNKKDGISSIIKVQGESLKRSGIEVDYFSIRGKGFFGYIRSVFYLRKFLRAKKFNLIHAHYSLSGFVASLSFSGLPTVVSLMGSDVKMNSFFILLIKLNYIFFWDSVLVKSIEMKECLNLANSLIIPNGVEVSEFSFRGRNEIQKKLNFSTQKKHILFLSDPGRYEKNFPLAMRAVRLLKNDSVVLHSVFDKPHEVIADYLYAADLLLLTSLWEGSPNVIKEAMACNCPIVSTDVGDVKWVIGETAGCYISSYDDMDVAAKINQALDFGSRTKGRDRIIKLGLDSDTIAQKICMIYKNVLEKK